MLNELERTSTGSNRAARSPALPVLGAAIVGILADSMGVASFLVWWLIAICALLVSLAVGVSRWPRQSTTALLVSCLALAGGWHHWRWNCVSDRDISGWATEEGERVRLQGRVLETPLIRITNVDSAPWLNSVRTSTVLECRLLIDAAGRRVKVAGHVRLTILGNRSDLSPGDLVEIYGKLTRPTAPANPGEFDSRRWLRALGIHAIVVADTPAAVSLLGKQKSILEVARYFRDSARRRADNLFVTRLSPENAAVAQSLLLGSRSDLDEDLRRAFAESGTLHVLAISGANVGLLWGLLGLVCRVLRWSPRMILISALILLPSYAVITDANPPVVRATIVAIVMVFGRLVRRGGSSWNSLAIAALLVLAWNPADLFNAGAQLSFLAVWVILVATGFLKGVRISPEREDASIDHQSLWSVGLAWLIQKVLEGALISLLIWVVTAPLIAYQFHLVSPVGVVLNVLLTPLLILMFWFGYVFLLFGMISSWLFGWLSIPFEILLGWFLGAVRQAAGLRLGHTYLPAPALWWLVGFYLVTGSLVVADQWSGKLYWSVRGVLSWTVLGLACSLSQGNSRQLTCTFLSVGHGLSVLIECPGGRTLLYDAGSLAGGPRTATIIENAIWASRLSRVDALIVSHADSDHCNAIPQLVRTIPASDLMIHRTFLDWSQPNVAAALQTSADEGARVRLIAEGQAIVADPEVEITILHPSQRFRSLLDNPNSLVLRLKYAGRTILLTGDLDGEGLYRVLAMKSVDTDILLAPHHGSLTANITDLARWARPEFVIASCRDDSLRGRLKAVYGPGAEVLTTAREGAVRCRIQSDGAVVIEPFRNP